MHVYDTKFNLQYSTMAYWNKRYAKKEEKFDWYQKYPTLKHVINPLVPQDEPVLQVSHTPYFGFLCPLSVPIAQPDICCPMLQIGVGNSHLQVEMVLDGYSSILSVDYADVVISQLQRAHADLPQLQYATADAR